jgi:hypothetical protein
VIGAAVRPNYAVWGDSHGVAMLPALGSFAERRGIAIQAYVQYGCPPLVGVKVIAPRSPKGCMDRNARTLAALESAHDIGTVILIARHAGYVKGLNISERHETYLERSSIFGPNGEELDETARTALWERQLDFTVNRLLAAGKTVVLVYPVPEIGYYVPGSLSRMLATGRDPLSLNLPLAAFQARQDSILPILDRAGTSPRIVRVYPHKRLCNEDRCLVYANGKALYRDADHLSAAGSEFVLPVFEPIFADHNPPTASAEVTSALAVRNGSAQNQP